MEKEIKEIKNLINNKKFIEAENLARILNTKYPQKFLILNLLAISLSFQNKLNEAKKILNNALKLKPDFANGHYNLGNILRDMGNLDEAISSYEKTIKIDSKFFMAFNNLGMILQSLKRYEESIKNYQTAIKIKPDFIEAYNNLGTVLQLLEKFKESSANYNKALKLNPNNASVNNNLASTLRSLEKFNESEKYYRKAISIKPDYFEAYYNLINLLRSLGRFDEAINLCQKSLKNNYNNFKIHELLIRLKWENNFGEKSFYELLKYIEKLKTPPVELIDLLINGLIATSQKDIVINLKKHLINKFPDNLDYKLRQATIDSSELIGNYQNALKIYEEINEKYTNSNLKFQISKMFFFVGKNQESLSLLNTLSNTSDLEFLQKVLAFKSHVLKYLKKDEYFVLCNYEKFLSNESLPTPIGWKSLEEFNLDLAKELEKLHLTKTQPFDQTLRNGTQSLNDLFKNCTSNNRCIQILKNLFDEAIQKYTKKLFGKDDHPFIKNIPGQIKILGSWSVRLKENGFHTNHFHPKGWLSSVYYVSLPEIVEEEDRLKRGWLKFGEPGHNKYNLLADKWIAPKVGRLILFPSYFWHGTEPFQSKEHRLTVAFDAK